MNTTERSGRLLKASFAILFREKRLLFFPLIVLALTSIAALFFLTPIAFQQTGFPYTSSNHWSAVLNSISASHLLHDQGEVAAKPQLWVKTWLAVMYFTSLFLATFCNVAFYHEIMQALNGNAVSVRNGFRFACLRWRSVLLWSLFAGVIGYLIQTIQERVGLLGKLITSFIGIAWSAACIFIIPTLVCGEETVNPLKLLRQSGRTLKRTWGELVIGFMGIEISFFLLGALLMLAIFATGGMAFYYLSDSAHVFLTRSYQQFSGAGIVWLTVGALFLITIPVSLITSVLNSVYRCALYIYATEGVIPESFDKELLDSAWKVK